MAYIYLEATSPLNGAHAVDVICQYAGQLEVQ